MPAASWTYSVISLISSMSTSRAPEVMLSSTWRAPRMSVSLSSGLDRADSTASMARCSPLATPVPMMATPESRRTVLTSSKSTFT